MYLVHQNEMITLVFVYNLHIYYMNSKHTILYGLYMIHE